MSRSTCRVIQLAPALIGLSLLSSNATADVCEAVLKNGAFNIYNSEYRRDLQENVLEEFCKTRWSTVDDFKKLAHSFKGGFDYFKVFAVNSDGRYNREGHNVAKDYENLCEKKDRAIVDRMFSGSHFQDASSAVEAWRDCIKDRKGFYAAPEVSPDGTRFYLNVHFIPGQGITTTATDVLELVSYPTDQGFTCNLDGREIRNLVPEKEGIGNTFSISCSKDKNASVRAVINTNLKDHSIGPFLIPDSAYAALLDEMSKNTENLARLEASSQQLAEAIAIGEATQVNLLRQRLFQAWQDPNSQPDRRQLTNFIRGQSLLDDGPPQPQNQRTLDVTYKNTLPYPIGVAVRTVGNPLTAADGTTMQHACSLKVRVDEQVLTILRRWEGDCAETFNVPSNSTYMVSGFSDFYLVQWDEVR